MPVPEAPEPLRPLLRHYGDEGGCHQHDHAQVLFGWRGRLELDVEGRAALVDPHCGLVVPPGVRHAYRADGTAQVLVLDCPPGPATERFRRFHLQAGWAEAAAGRQMLWSMLGEAPRVLQRRSLDLDALAARIDADPARDWTVLDLAAACHLSPQRLRARFAESLGLSPLAWVRQRRLRAASERLERGWTLEAAALSVGYGSASALSAALRREQGTGARALRRAGRALRTT